MIYVLNDLTSGQAIYFVSDANIQAEGQALNIPNTIWNIGTIDDANALLPSIQQSYLELYKDSFSVCSTIVNEDGTQTWKSCDLTQEHPNTAHIYQVFNPLTALHTEVIGLENAYNQVELTKQAFLEWSRLTIPTTLDSLPQPIRFGTSGTQTI